MTTLDQVRAIVTSWRENTELSAARCMHELAKLLEIEPPKPVAGKVRRRAERANPSEHLPDNRCIE